MANWFVGIPVGGGWLDGLLAGAPRHVRTFAAEDVHMTVAFLGPAGEANARKAWALAETYSGPPVHATLGALAPMGNPRRPSALSLLLTEGVEEAVSLIRALRDPMIAAAGARPETREPKPHITVARPRRAATAKERAEAVSWALAKASLDQPIVLDRLVLYTRNIGDGNDDRAVRQFRAVATRRLG
jgi:RNA 2',3'-cyclic 3'-phosphodiesterase